MPDSYINPPYSPPQAGKKWFPTTLAKGDDIGTGYSIARCVRGQFYNVQATKSSLETDKILVTISGSVLTDEDSEIWPFFNTYRPLTNPTSYIGLPPMKSFVLGNELNEDFTIATSLNYKIKLPNFTFKLGCFTIEYSLSFDPFDDSISNFITNEEHLAKIDAYRKGDSSALSDFPFNEYNLISLLLEGKQFNPDNGTVPLTLSLTGIHKEVSNNGVSTTSYPETIKKNLLTGTSISALSRPSADNLELALTNESANCSSLRLRIKNIWIFRAFDETNLNPRNLPCSILGYAVTLRKAIDPEKNTYFVTFPKGDNYRPTVNLKLFNPEARTNSPGFAHGVNLRFYFASVPVSGAFDLLAGIGLESPFTIYQFTLLGIQAGKRQARYVFFEDQKIKKENPASQYWKLNKVATISKKEDFSIKQTINQEPGLLEFDQEIATFVALDETNPVSLKNGVNFSKGLFRASFETQTINNFNNNNYHIYFRMWFAPKDSFSKNNLTSYRSQTEVCFESNATTTKLVRKSPTKYDEVLIAPPSPTNLTQYEIARYISDKQIISMPDASFDQAVLVVGVYVRASGTKVSGTVVNFAFDTEKNGFDTPIYQVISNELHAIRNPSETSFTSNSYLKIANSLKVSSSLTGRRPIPITYEQAADFDKNYEYIPYKNKFVSFAGSDNSYAFEDVALLKKPDAFESYDTGKLNVPITEELFRTLSKTTSPSKTIITDFVTDVVSLQNGRINSGAWEIEVKRNRIGDVSIDFNLIIEGLLVDVEGKVVSRLFKSPELKGAGLSFQTYTYRTNISFPFLIDGAETQFVLRLTYLPYCDLNFTYSELKEYYDKNLKIKFGFRIDSIEIKQNTIEQERIIYNAPSTPSAIGSPAYYEDLPLAPTKILGADADKDSQFYFIASPESLGTKTVTLQDPYVLRGTLYSPTWYVNLPSDMEVRFNHNFGSAEPKFRTVAGVADLAEDSIGVVNSGFSDTFIVAYTSNRTSASELGEIDILRVNSYGSSFDQYTVANYNSSGSVVANLNGSKPKLLNFSVSNSNSGSADQIYLMTEAVSSEGNYISAALNQNDGDAKRWGLPAEQRYATTPGFGQEVKKIFSGFNLFTAAIDKASQTFYGAGFAQPGSLIFKINRSVNVSSDGKNEYRNYLLAGDKPEDLSLFPGLIDLRTPEEIKTVDNLLATHVDLIKLNSNDFLLQYVKNSSQYAIKSKSFNLSQPSPEFTLFTFEGLIPTLYSALQIYGISSKYDSIRRLLHTVFWCDSKLFYFKTSYSGYPGGANINPKLQLVAGNFTLDEKNKLVYELEKQKYLVMNNNDKDEKVDIVLQRAGISLENKGTSSSISVWYKDRDNTIVSRNIIPYSYVSEKKYYKGLS